MRRHAHLVLPLTALIAALFVIVWPNLQARMSGRAASADILGTSSASAAASSTYAVRLAISRLGIDAPVVEPDGRTEEAYQHALYNGVAHYPGTAMPGQPGNAYFFGHSSDYFWSPGSYKDVFAKLMSIRAGDAIEVTNASGTPFRYVVTGTKVVSPKELSVLAQGDGQKKMLTLQTSYPLGTALKRFIVTADLAPYAGE